MEGHFTDHQGHLRPQPTLLHTYRAVADNGIWDHLESKRYPADQVVVPMPISGDRGRWIDGDSLVGILSEDYKQAIGVSTMLGAVNAEVIASVAGLPFAPGSAMRFRDGMTQAERNEHAAQMLLDEIGFGGWTLGNYIGSGERETPEHEGIRIQNFGLGMVTISTPVPLRVGTWAKLAIDPTFFPGSQMGPSTNDGRVPFTLAPWTMGDNYPTMQLDVRTYVDDLAADPAAFSHQQMDLQTSNRRNNVFYSKKSRRGEKAVSGALAIVLAALPVLVNANLVAGISPDTESIEDVLAEKFGFAGSNIDPDLIAKLARALFLREVDSPSLEPDVHSIQEDGARMLFDAQAEIHVSNRPHVKIMDHKEQPLDAPKNMHTYDVWCPE